jgi:hypothetical protein
MITKSSAPHRGAGIGLVELLRGAKHIVDSVTKNHLDTVVMILFKKRIAMSFG